MSTMSTSRHGQHRRSGALPPVKATSPRKGGGGKRRAKKEWVSVYTDKGAPEVDALACACSACHTARPKLSSAKTATHTGGRGGGGGSTGHGSSRGSTRAPKGRPRRSALERLRQPFKVGDRCIVKGNRVGVVRWIGQFDSDYVSYDTHVGIQLDDPVGAHDGIRKGKRYFTCRPHHGLFVLKKDVLFVKGRYDLSYRAVSEVAQEKQRVANAAQTLPARLPKLGATADKAPRRAKSTKARVSSNPTTVTTTTTKSGEEAGEADMNPVLRKLMDAQLQGQRLVEQEQAEGQAGNDGDDGGDDGVETDEASLTEAEAAARESVRRQVDEARQELEQLDATGAAEEDHQPDITASSTAVGSKYAGVEDEIRGVIARKDKAELDAMWRRLDFNGNNIVSLAEIDKFLMEQYPVLDSKPAAMRAYKKTTLRDGDGDAWVEKKEFIALLRNVLYFNKAFDAFDEIDAGGDRRIDEAEFTAGLGVVGLSLPEDEAAAAFRGIDRNGGGQILFDEFCAWIAEQHCPVDGELVDEFVLTGQPEKAATPPPPEATPPPPKATTPPEATPPPPEATASPPEATLPTPEPTPSPEATNPATPPPPEVAAPPPASKKSSEMVVDESLVQEVLRDVFTRADANGDGVLDASEFPGLLASPQLNLKLSPEQCALIMQAVDVDSSGTVDYSEFTASFSTLLRKQMSGTTEDEGWTEVFHDSRGMMLYFNRATSEVKIEMPPGFPEENRSIYTAPTDPLEALVLSAFIAADVNSDAKLDEDEFWAVLNNPALGLTLTQELIDGIYSQVEVDDSGFISYPLFIPVGRRILSLAYFSHLRPAEHVAYQTPDATFYYHIESGVTALEAPPSFVEYAPPESA